MNVPCREPELEVCGEVLGPQRRRRIVVQHDQISGGANPQRPGLTAEDARRQRWILPPEHLWRLRPTDARVAALVAVKQRGRAGRTEHVGAHPVRSEPQ